MKQLSPLLPPTGKGGPTPSSAHRVKVLMVVFINWTSCCHAVIDSAFLLSSLQPIQPAALPLSMPLTPDLSPMSPTFLPFKSPELKSDRGDSPAPSAGVYLSTQIVRGSLSGFSPIKGVCPLDVFRGHIRLQRGPDSPALTPQDPAQLHPTIYTLQPKAGGPDAPSTGQLKTQLHPLQHSQCSGCSPDEGCQRGAAREAKVRPPMPARQFVPVNLDCSVQVSELMRGPLDSSQVQTFHRRLSEALSQDLSAKPPCSPITPPPEQPLPLNLSKRVAPKRPSAEGPEHGLPTVNGNSHPMSSERSPSRFQEQAQDFSLRGRTGAGAAPTLQGQEEPADLSSPHRIRAFLLGLPRFQVKLEEDLNGTRFAKFPPPAETKRTDVGEGGVTTEVEQEEAMGKEQAERESTLCPGPAPSNTDTHCF